MGSSTNKTSYKDKLAMEQCFRKFLNIDPKRSFSVKEYRKTPEDAPLYVIADDDRSNPTGYNGTIYERKDKDMRFIRLCPLRVPGWEDARVFDPSTDRNVISKSKKIMKYYDCMNIRVLYYNNEVVLASSNGIVLKNSLYPGNVEGAKNIRDEFMKVMPPASDLFDLTAAYSSTVYHFLFIHEMFAHVSRQDMTSRAILYDTSEISPFNQKDVKPGKGFPISEEPFINSADDAEAFMEHGFDGEGGSILVMRANDRQRYDLISSKKHHSNMQLFGWTTFNVVVRTFDLYDEFEFKDLKDEDGNPYDGPDVDDYRIKLWTIYHAITAVKSTPPSDNDKKCIRDFIDLKPRIPEYIAKALQDYFNDVNRSAVVRFFDKANKIAAATQLFVAVPGRKYPLDVNKFKDNLDKCQELKDDFDELLKFVTKIYSDAQIPLRKEYMLVTGIGLYERLSKKEE